MLGLAQIWCPYSKLRELVIKGYYYSTSITIMYYSSFENWVFGFSSPLSTQKIGMNYCMIIYDYKVIYSQAEEFCAYLCTGFG